MSTFGTRQPVKFGVYVPNQHPRAADPRAALDDQISFVHQVRDHGWDSLWTGQHFLTEETSQLSTVVTLTRMAVEAGDMELGVGLFLLPLLNPVEVAEHVASLSVITGGRLIVGVGVGYRDLEYAAFGVPKPEAVQRFTENFRILKGLLAGDQVDATVPWCSLNGATLSVHPAQMPDLWIGANADAGVRRAARLADAWLINPHAPLSTVLRQRAMFDSTRQKAALPAPSTTPIMREVLCAPRSEDAHELAARYLGAKYATYSSWGQDDVLPDNDTFDAPFRDLSDGRFVVGNPEECLRALIRWQHTVGANHFLFRMHWAGMPWDAAERSLGLLTSEVLPVLRAGH